LLKAGKLPSMPPSRISLLKISLPLIIAALFLFSAQALGKTKDTAVSCAMLGEQLRQMGRYPEAIHQYSEAIKLDRKNAHYYQSRADCEIATTSYANAVRDLSRSIKLSPTDPETLSMRAHTFNLMKNYKKEKQDLDRLVDLQPTGTNMLMRAESKMHLKNYASALDDCNAAINTGLAREQLAELYHVRSDAYKKLGKKPQYEQELAKYNSLLP
jgi:predicted Zn-dependent protease